MSTIHKFKYPIFYSIVYALGFLMMLTITIGMTFSLIKEGDFHMVDKKWGYFLFNIAISTLLPAFLMSIGIIGVRRLRFSFITITLDTDKKILSIKRGNNYKEIKLSDIESSRDIPKKGILQINTNRHSILIPKEIGNFSILYGLLKEYIFLREKEQKAGLEGYKTKLGLLYWVFGSGIFIFGLFPLLMLPDLIINYDGSSNTITGLIILPLLGFGMILLSLLLANRYEFTKESLIKRNPLYKKEIPYSNIDSIDYDEIQRTITINLIEDKLKKLRKLNGQTGIIIMEPSNISIENIYRELERKRTTYNNAYSK